MKHSRNTHPPTLVWFRRDLRLHDQPALRAALAEGRPLLCLFVLDDSNPRPLGGASRWWLHHSLEALGSALAKAGGQLQLLRGDPCVLIPQLVERHAIASVHCQRLYELHERSLEQALVATLNASGIPLHRHSGYLLFEPEHISSQSGAPYKVFTPFWRACQAQLHMSKPQGVPRTIAGFGAPATSLSLDDLALLPTHPDWASPFHAHWQPGEMGARKQLKRFLSEALKHYDQGRDIPSATLTSRLSPHLHFGEISVGEVLFQTRQATGAADHHITRFASELGWREFSHHLLWHWPNLAEKPFNPKYRHFPWRRDPTALRRWQRGQTGIPIVDAGMRELWATGWMHNRVRMIVGSLLVKNLLLHWREGEAWFWDTLVDASAANNAASWQWVAGCGADAAPYFRIFNPVTQAQKFDPEGIYIRRWVPELAALPAKYLACPWEAPASVLRQAGVTLGEHYPTPIIELKGSRQRALDALARCNEAQPG